jgi:hypothetical protein
MAAPRTNLCRTPTLRENHVLKRVFEQRAFSSVLWQDFTPKTIPIKRRFGGEETVKIAALPLLLSLPLVLHTDERDTG